MNSKVASQTPCRNILIHGYCKYADKGCIFKHDNGSESSTASTVSSAPVASKKKLNADSAVFTPSASFHSSTAKNVAAPVFTPRSAGSATNDTVSEDPVSVASTATAPATSISPASARHFDPEKVFSPLAPIHIPSATTDDVLSSETAGYSSAPQDDDYSIPHNAGPPDPNLAYANTNQTSIYQNNSAYPLMYHLYAPTPLGANRTLLNAHERLVEDFFVSNDIREELQRKNEATRQAIPGLQLPDCVHVYHSLVPLDMNINKSNKIYGYPTWAYKVESNLDGRIYCMRRIEGYKLTNEKSMRLLKWWGRVSSPGVVDLKEAFTTKAFGDNSLIFIYDYYPLSMTLESVYYDPQNVYQVHGRTSISEELLWGFTAQILNALRSIHKAKLAARVIEASKIIMTKKNRIRLNCLGVMDFLNFENPGDMTELQKEDLAKTGKLLLSLAATSQTTSLETNLEIAQKKFSSEFVSMINDLLAGTDLKEVMNEYCYHFMDVVNSALFDSDKLEEELSKEVENGRLVRLLAKLGFINDRPEFQNDRSWSEQGERYLIQLFRDYVFHQADDNGHPHVDLNHVLTCLNKLDAGIDETILLVSRDEQSSYIVSYKELKSNIEAAFRELSRK